MLEFWILKSPLNTMRGTPARHRAAFCWLQHRICRGLLLLGWNKRNLLISNPVRRPLILPKWQRIHSSQPSRWRVKAWSGFHFHIRLQHNRRTKKEGSIKAQNRNISYTAFQPSSTDPHICSKCWLYTAILLMKVLKEKFQACETV